MPIAKKSLGQHFLTDPAICQRIVNLLEPDKTDNILEIGPGAGALTRFLANAPHAFMLLLEKDRDLTKLHKNLGNTQIVNCDAMNFFWENLCGNWKIIGNLPYNVASPLIWDIAARCKSLQKAVFMVQKEVGKRIAAKPGTKEYGALSVWVQNFLNPLIQFQLAPGAFTPPPKVHSLVLSFTPIAEKPENPGKLKKLLDLCFQKRRKQLGVILRQAKIGEFEKILEKLAINSACRPEELTPLQFRQLANGLF